MVIFNDRNLMDKVWLDEEKWIPVGEGIDGYPEKEQLLGNYFIAGGNDN